MRGDGRGQQQKDHPDHGTYCNGRVLRKHSDCNENQSASDGAGLGGRMHPRIEIGQAHHAHGGQEREHRAKY